jgi:hypothetical protein
LKDAHRDEWLICSEMQLPQQIERIEGLGRAGDMEIELR